jgi:hypothetical protein
MTIREIESQVERLGPKELQEFRAWFQAFDAKAWDEQLESDIGAGRLSHLAEQALRDYEDGKCTDL